MILAGDIGGTRSRFYAIEGDKIVFEHVYSSKDYADFSEIVADFVRKSGLKFSVCVFGIAGVVMNGRCKTTNLPWEVSIEEIKNAAGCKEGYLINDLSLLSYGISQLAHDQFESLQDGQKKDGPMLVVCPGTGLGVACITQKNPFLQILPTEAGHIDFPPTSHLEQELLNDFYTQHEHVSIERFVSGSGLMNVYKFLCKKEGIKPLYTSSEQITEAALSGSDQIAKKTIVFFWEMFASTLGNLALIYLPFQGIYLCGSLLKKLYPFFDEKTFKERFSNKGRFKSTLENMPIYFVKEQKLAPLGTRAFIKNLKEMKHAG